MFRSIRWALQLWHALLLLVVVCIFGAVLYFRLQHTRFQAIDTELQASAEVLAARIRPGPPRRGPGRFPRPATNPAGPGEPFGRHHEPDRPPSGEVDFAWLDELEKQSDIPEGVLRQFHRDGAGSLYFAIWRSNGELLRTSRAGLQIPAPAPRAHFSDPPPQFRQRGDLREAIVPGPFAMQVLVGRSIQKEQAELRQLLMLLGITGGGVMVVGLLGGWLLAGRVIRPIRAITATARSISASNLSRRIDSADTDNELGALAAVLNAMFARLETAFDQQVRFTADASHELRTPLSIIYSHAELALARERSAPEYRESLEACFRASRRMKGLVESLLVLARADAGKLEIKQEPVDLAQVARDCVDLLGPLADQKKVQLELCLQPVTLTGDLFRITQVLTNLVSNAIHYNREGGRVSVGVQAVDGQAIVKIADTGVGIAPEDQPHLFERFFRVDKARSRALGGCGLGLAITRSIIDAHGGSITFKSELNQGTTFEVRLPRVPPEPGQ